MSTQPNIPTDKPFPRWFQSKISLSVVRYDSKEKGKIVKGEYNGDVYNVSIEDIEKDSLGRELTQQEAEEILRGEK